MAGVEVWSELAVNCEGSDEEVFKSSAGTDSVSSRYLYHRISFSLKETRNVVWPWLFFDITTQIISPPSYNLGGRVTMIAGSLPPVLYSASHTLTVTKRYVPFLESPSG